MKSRLPILILILFSAAIPISAATYHFSGGGGFSMGIHNPDLGFLDKEIQIQTPGFKKIDGPLYLWGGFGYGEVTDNIRIGGYGFGGGTTVSGRIPNATQLRQDVTIGLGAGGFLAEYVLINAARRFEADFDLGLGFGGMDISITQFGPNISWDDLMGSLDPANAALRETFSMKLTRSFFMVDPSVAVKYYINSFMAIEARAGYLFMLGIEDWRFEDVKVLDMPDADLSAPVFGLRVTFGG